MPQPQIAETDHFWYRLQPEGIYIDSQRDNRAFGYDDGHVLLSEDCGRTWPYRLPFPEARKITFSHIFANGNVIFATDTSIYTATDRLGTCEPITLTDVDGSEYHPHAPRNPEFPGWYFHTIPGVNSWDVNGRELLVWGNLCNVLGGAAPVNIYYSADGGESVRIAYSFGQNPYARDNGTPTGGTDGPLLGNPDNPVFARHVHDVSYNPAENAFYACTGDGDRPEGFECRWLRGTWDPVEDSWDWRTVHADHLNSRYKGGGINFVDGRLYWISDANGPEPYDRGIFSCAPEDLPNPERHTLLFDPQVESANMIVEGDVFLASHCAPASPLQTGIIISTDAGATWAQYDLAGFGKRSPMRFHRRNADGWFRMSLHKRWFDRGEVLFLKPKTP